ncbi:hypothetical protein Q4566_14845 [Tamlana sp. 2_MG-2023]|uniref:hypothetical protein n=1 Tax=unclassified Tamlana TaxID=2614803 RepID=UPI0026E1D874|nr:MULTISPECIES: hypothetical protein [unclassified Tamlana]MDO6761487.1 hypothetical protein [Tamlana sp. 2_MG-2023]MDO6792338.1 hypothetical protein [Tamlana sp. 1_MG-2023]
MKKLLIGIFTLGFTTLMFAQVSYESDDLLLLKYKTATAVHSQYLSTVLEMQTAKRIRSLESTVANYDITKQALFNKKSINGYQVVFEEHDQYEGSIIANYNSAGELTKSFERYKDVSLPYSVRYSVTKAHPGCSFVSTVYYVSYVPHKPIEKTYKIKIKVDGSKKTLKVDENGQIL